MPGNVGSESRSRRSGRVPNTKKRKDVSIQSRQEAAATTGTGIAAKAPAQRRMDEAVGVGVFFLRAEMGRKTGKAGIQRWIG